MAEVLLCAPAVPLELKRLHLPVQPCRCWQLGPRFLQQRSAKPWIWDNGWCFKDNRRAQSFSNRGRGTPCPNCSIFWARCRSSHIEELVAAFIRAVWPLSEEISRVTDCSKLVEVAPADQSDVRGFLSCLVMSLYSRGKTARMMILVMIDWIWF